MNASLYTTSCAVQAMPVAEFLRRYPAPEKFRDSCSGCPSYHKVWSCPPGLPGTAAFFQPFSRIVLIGGKVMYADALQKEARISGRTDRLRADSYGAVKKVLLETQLGLERALPGSLAIAAGRCEQCARCAREDGLPCRRPERLRCSFSVFQVDLGAIAEEQLHMPLLWQADGLPPYNVAIGALLLPG